MKTWIAVLTLLLMVSSPGASVLAAAAECPEIETAEGKLRTWSVAMREDDVQAPRGQEEVQAPRGQEEVQAPRGQEEVQAPRGQDEVQAPRGQEEVQAPRSQEEVQAPRGQEAVQAPYAGIRYRNGVQAPRGAGPKAARLEAIRLLIKDARASCDRGDRAVARQKALAAMDLMREAP